MIYWIFIFLLVLMLLNLIIEIILTDKELKIKVFGIRVFYLKGEALDNFFKKLFSENENKKESDFSRTKIKILNVKIVLNEVVNNYSLFAIKNELLLSLINKGYFYIRNYVPNFYYCYKANETNFFIVTVKLKVNLLFSLAMLLKGKNSYVTKRN